jgi:L-threonylcarbamoyladenylate synthase
VSAADGRGGTLAREDGRRLAECLADGGVAVFPTDTVYGLACDPQQRAAVDRLYELKGRPAEQPAAVMFFSLDSALAELSGLATRERAAARALLPGPVTLLLPNPAHRFALACGPDPGTLGLRVPLLAQSLAVLAQVRAPLLQSSANLSGAPAVRRVDQLPDELCKEADLVLDAGELPGTASTVVDLRSLQHSGEWRIVREGALGSAEVRRALMLAS